MNALYPMLEERNLVAKIEYEDSDVVARGNVIRQSVDAGITVNTQTEITIYISNGRDDAKEIRAEDAVITNEVQQEYEETTTSAPIFTFTSPATTEEPLITVPTVTGQTEGVATASLMNLGLSASVSYKHDENRTDGEVISQSVAAGSQVKNGTAIVLVVCNNAKKTQYATRTVSTETTTGSSNTMAGWELYDTEMLWGEYGTWSDWNTTAVTGSESREVQTTTMYQYRDKTTKSVTSVSENYGEADWTVESKSGATYGNWTNYTGQTSVPAAKEGLQVETTKTNTVTTYTYYHYATDMGNPKLDLDSIRVNDKSQKHTIVRTTPFAKVKNPIEDRGGKKTEEYGGAGAEGTGCSSCKLHIWWLESQKTTTTYDYRTRSYSYAYVLSQWGNWTDFSTNSVTASGSREVKTTMGYRYRDRTASYIYHFKRTNYGSFSEWSDIQPEAQDGIEITTREVYIY